MRLRRNKYKAPRFPDAEFVMLVAPNGAEDGPFRISQFIPVQDGDGAWVFWPGNDGGSPRMLRITEQRGDRITTVDGTGKAYRYRLAPYNLPPEQQAA